MNKKIVLFIIVAFIVGLIVGIILWQSGADVTGYVTWVQPFGQILVSMLKMIVIPVILLSLITGAASIPLKQFGKVGLKVIIWYFLTSLLASILGSVVALAFNPGGDTSRAVWEQLLTGTTGLEEPTAGGSLVSVLLSMFQNPFSALAEGNFLAIIVFSIGFGLALKILSERNKFQFEKAVDSLLSLLDTAKEAIFVIVEWILAYSPIGVFALTSTNFALYGSRLFGPYITLTIGVVLGILGMIFIVYPIMMAITLKENPFKIILALKEPILTAFVTRSSAATLPVSMQVSTDELGVDESLASFSLPLGATINMDGVCIHLPMFAVLAANLFGVNMDFTTLAVLVITTVLASVGAGGVPGGSLMLLFIILQNMGLDSGQIALIAGLALGINPILDMFETMNNVTGDLVATYSVAKMSKLVNKD
ncbi:MAG: dicarboxylate/amino acid:cation symporter [Clostridiales bacterium]|nr:MAG: dicarboxylate/amino acid:cation symporter [Clostridiales bacterium]